MKIKPVYLIGLLLLLFIFGAYKEAKAEITVEAGAGFLSGQYSQGQALIFTERWGGPYGTRYAIGMGYITKQEVIPRTEPLTQVRENLFVQAQRRVSFNIKGCKHDCISIGIGVAYFNATNRALGSNFTAAVSIELRPTEHWSFNIRHWSNAGSSPPNMGQDMITMGYSF